VRFYQEEERRGTFYAIQINKGQDPKPILEAVCIKFFSPIF